ncbi:MAG: glycosyltransferase family 2 protein [Thermoleophilaceae bacterium]|nr:glycosyltransferase family 2 protein [Thermoleophilaceae bacterium]
MSTVETPSGASAAPGPDSRALTVSVVIPCLNEAESIAECVTRARTAMDGAGISGEVVVADNGSTDGSPELAEGAGARVIPEPRKGYGSAYLAGMGAARGDYIVMADADLTYDFAEIPAFVEPLEDGADLVMGSRLKGKIHPGAMPPLHRYVGNPILTGILNLFFRTGVSDAHCGMRAFRRDLLPKLDLRTTGMEFASEHVIRSSKLGLDIREIPIEYHPRAGESKLSSFSDGWRHLRFLLVHSPTWLFVIPGAAMLLAGLVATLLVLGEVSTFGERFHTLIAGAMLAIIGSQIIQLGLFSRTYAAYYLGEHDPLFDTWRERLRLEHGLMLGGLLTLAGLACVVVVFGVWASDGFGRLEQEKLLVVGATLLVLGIQTVFGAFFLSILGLRRRQPTQEEPGPMHPA